MGFSLRQFLDVLKIRDAAGRPCVRAFLSELLQQVEISQLPAKDWLKVANQVLKLATGNRARKIGNKHQLNWSEVLPLTAIAKIVEGASK